MLEADQDVLFYFLRFDLLRFFLLTITNKSWKYSIITKYLPSVQDRNNITSTALIFFYVFIHVGAGSSVCFCYEVIVLRFLPKRLSENFLFYVILGSIFYHFVDFYNFVLFVKVETVCLQHIFCFCKHHVLKFIKGGECNCNVEGPSERKGGVQLCYHSQW